MCLLKWIAYHLGSNLQNYTKLNMSTDFIQGMFAKNCLQKHEIDQEDKIKKARQC